MSWLLWSLLSALFAAVTAVLAKKGVADINSNLATAVRTTVVFVFAWAVTLVSNTHVGIGLIQRRGWIYLLISGLATGFSWLCYFRALSLGPASKVAPIDKLSVVFVILLAAVALGEPLTIKKVIGGTLIGLGALILA